MWECKWEREGRQGKKERERGREKRWNALFLAKKLVAPLLSPSVSVSSMRF